MGKKKNVGTDDMQRMIGGRLYNCTDKSIMAKHVLALRRCEKYNRSAIWNVPKRNRIIKKLIPNHGENFFIMTRFNCEYGFNITFGDDFFANFDCMMLDVAPIKIGKGVMFGPRVIIATPMHPLLAKERAQQQFPDGYHDIEYAKPITIGDGVWIASNVTVCGGVTIGDGAVIAAGSVVTRDIPPNCLAAGSPCKVLRSLDDGDRMNVWETYLADDMPLSQRNKAKAQTN